MLENFSEVVTYENLGTTFDSSFEQITKNFTFSPVILCFKIKIQVIALACLYRLDFSQNSQATISKILGNFCQLRFMPSKPGQACSEIAQRNSLAMPRPSCRPLQFERNREKSDL